MKRKFIAYHPPYGGQSLKTRNHEELIQTIDCFLGKLTDGKNPDDFWEQWVSGAREEYCSKWERKIEIN